ncbi:MAG: hypothetical protein IJM03_03655 [Treponema sp.]|nr:hypothetical protein [Treponema sp.]
MTGKTIKEELQVYSEQYCENELKNAGFTSYRDDKINWYKVYNGIICHFHLVSYSSRIPGMMMVWRIHPTYVPATLNIPVVWMRFKESGLWFFDPTQAQIHLAPRSVVIYGGMNRPNQPETATDRLVQEFFPLIERLHTREELYKFKRNEILFKAKNPKISLFNLTKPDFADEALLMKDSELFPPCITCIEKNIPYASNEHLQSTYYRSPELLKAQLKALQGEDVDQYFAMLKERKDKFLKRYKLQDEAFDL